jgi:hypothetical protein
MERRTPPSAYENPGRGVRRIMKRATFFGRARLDRMAKLRRADALDDPKPGIPAAPSVVYIFPPQVHHLTATNVTSTGTDEPFLPTQACGTLDLENATCALS